MLFFKATEFVHEALPMQYCSVSHPVSGGRWFPFSNVQNVPCTHVDVLSLSCWWTVWRSFGARAVSEHTQAPIVARPELGWGLQAVLREK